MSIIGQSVLFARGCFDHLRGEGVVSVAGGLRIFETPDVSDRLFVLSNKPFHFISYTDLLDLIPFFLLLYSPGLLGILLALI